jgi:hypothetical protein
MNHLSPIETVDAFLAACPPEKVEAMLWELFGLAALGGLGEKGLLLEDGKVMTAEEVAPLMDQLIALVKALDVFRKAGGARYLELEGGAADV